MIPISNSCLICLSFLIFLIFVFGSSWRSCHFYPHHCPRCCQNLNFCAFFSGGSPQYSPSPHQILPDHSTLTWTWTLSTFEFWIRLTSPTENMANFAALKDDVLALLAEKPCGPILIRLSWHDAGTFCSQTNTGGPRGAQRFPEGESQWGANAGLDIARGQHFH